MYNYTCLNPIAGVGLDLFSEDYKKEYPNTLIKINNAYFKILK